MIKSYRDISTGGLLTFDERSKGFEGAALGEQGEKGLLTIAWNQGPDQSISIDGIRHLWKSGDILTMMSSQTYEMTEKAIDITYWRFNKDFYCIIDHDKEVSCVGFLFYGWQQVMFIAHTPDLTRKLDLLSQVFEDEFEANDNIQGEMLRMLLKRLIIILTRQAKSQLPEVSNKEDTEEFDLIRSFNLLVEEHFKDAHQVQDYASMLHKSPKTLSNLFRKYQVDSPLHIIQERIALEAKRLLIYTDKSISEISHELGFAEPTHFSRFFKKINKSSPKSFKESFSLN